MTSKHLLSLTDLDSSDLIEILDLADQLKTDRGRPDAPQPLRGRSVAMIFAKSSTRTRISFEVGIHELGALCMFFNKNDLQMGRGEPVADTAKVLSRYVHGIIVRTDNHEELEEFAQYADIPVINALTDRYHPCQLLADLQTIREDAGQLNDEIHVAFVGDGASNMAHSWVLAADLAGIHLTIGAPPMYQPGPDVLGDLKEPGLITVTDDPAAAVQGANYVYTDVWVSMGFEEEADKRIAALEPYQVNSELLANATDDVKVMHCLPAHRGQEITGDVLDGPRSLVWEEAENRLHVQKALLVLMFSNNT